MKQPENLSKNYNSLINEIENGEIKIPQFQRDFVWDLKKSANLLDSIIKGYPIGTFIFWRTRERLRSIRNLGSLTLKEAEKGEYLNYVLDGQQRLTSLFASLKGLNVQNNAGKEVDYSNIFIDLDANEDYEQVVRTDIHDLSQSSYIKVKDLLEGDISFLASFPENVRDKIQDYRKRFEAFSFPIIQLKEVSIDVATEVFTRINVTGQDLTLFEIMVAKTYDESKEFDLAEKYNEFKEKLRPIDYETISPATILQVIAILLQGKCKREQILRLDKKDLINIWDTAINCVNFTIDYLRNYFRIPASRILPYNALVVPLSYFFYYNQKNPTGYKARLLEDFFWRCALTGRYSSAVEGKLAQDIMKIDNILDEVEPGYEWGLDISPTFIKNHGSFSVGRSFIKAILALYAYYEPQSFDSNAKVNISNNWMHRANSKNFHHFFPKAFMRKNQPGIGDHLVNNVLNITIVDDFLNKNKIGHTSPSKYLQEFKKKNPYLNDSMKSHLIDDMDKFGVWENDFERFIDERANLVSKKLQERILPKETDQQFELDYDENIDFEINSF